VTVRLAICDFHCRFAIPLSLTGFVISGYATMRSDIVCAVFCCLTSSEIRRVVLIVLSSFLRQSCSVFTNVTSALEVFFKKCYALYKSPFYLLTYLRLVSSGLHVFSVTAFHLLSSLFQSASLVSVFLLN